MEDLHEKIVRIARYYGYEHQTHKLMEEMGELQTAINKMWEKEQEIEGYAILHEERMEIYKEIADVEILLEQIKHLLNCRDEVESIKHYKVNRQLGRMEKREKERNSNNE